MSCSSVGPLRMGLPLMLTTCCPSDLEANMGQNEVMGCCAMMSDGDAPAAQGLSDSLLGVGRHTRRVSRLHGEMRRIYSALWTGALRRVRLLPQLRSCLPEALFNLISLVGVRDALFGHAIHRQIHPSLFTASIETLDPLFYKLCFPELLFPTSRTLTPGLFRNPVSS